MPSLRSSRKVAFASLIGTTIEWYDFFIFGTAAALIFNKVFFPSFDPVTGTLAAFASFSVGFIARPFGGVVFAHYGDKIGRKPMLVYSLLLMGAATVLMGLLPGYASIGIWAPILLVVLRFAQGFGVGGEWGGAALMAVEHAPRAPAWLLRRLAPSRRAGRPPPGNGCVRPAVGNADRRAVPRVGMAGSIPGQRAAHRRRHVDPARRGRESGLSEDTRCEAGREDARARRPQDLPEGDRAGCRIIRGHQRQFLHRVGLADFLRDDQTRLRSHRRSSPPTRL